MGRQGMVTTPHYLASFAGARIILQGGNAVDAAIAANAVLNVVYPHNCSPGGDAFWIIYDSKTGKLKGLNGSGRSPYAADSSFFKERGFSRIPPRGILPVTVPGVVDSWCTMLKEYGSMKLDQLLKQAIYYAEKGFPVSEKLSESIKDEFSVLSASPTSARIFLNDNRVFQPGEILIQRNLASTFRKIAAEGRDCFYRGTISKAIVEFSKENGGLLSEEDFADHTSDWVDLIGTNYRGYDVYELPPNSQGITTLLELNIIENFDVSALGSLSSDLIHILVEAKKLAFADRDRYVSDPEKIPIPVKELISKAYAESRGKEIRLNRASENSHSGRTGGEDTVYLATVDNERNAVSLIQSIYFPFGSGVVAGDTGILLQNRGAYFSLEDDHVNRLEPHKQTLHTLAPAIMFKDGQLRMVFGTMGGDGQPQTQVQIITNIVDFKMNVQEAIEAPRWLHRNVTIGEPETTLDLEEGIGPSVSSELQKRGHQIRMLRRWDEDFGHAQAVLINPRNGVLMGGADPRGDGVAIGW